MKANCLPRFFVVGAQKAGTTTLNNLLLREPGVEVPAIKETHYFSDDQRNIRGIEWYLKCFVSKGAEAVRGEVDPDYLFFQQAALRIAQIIPAAKILIILRNPLDRAYSHYRMSVRRGLEDLSFVEALALESHRIARGSLLSLKQHSYAARGRYAEQIKHWKHALPRADFLFIRFDDFVDPIIRPNTYRCICEFIGTKATLSPAEMEVVCNPASTPKSTAINRLLWGDSALKRLLRPMVFLLIPQKDSRGKFARMLDLWNQRPDTRTLTDWRSTLPPEVFTFFDNEIHKAETASGLDLAHWYSDEYDKAIGTETIQ